jgi:hypothetical protein
MLPALQGLPELWRMRYRGRGFMLRAGERLEGTLLLDFPDGDGELVIPQPRVPG